MTSSRFQDAAALVRRAKERLPGLRAAYEKAIAAGEVSAELKMDVKEIIDCLRSALDYCARELYERYGAPTKKGTKPKVYFPIAPAGSDWKSFLGKSIPGLDEKRPDLARTLERYQPAADPRNNQWLADLAFLSIENKHAQLSAQAPQRMPWVDAPPGFIIMDSHDIIIEDVVVNGHRLEGPLRLDTDHLPENLPDWMQVGSSTVFVWRIDQRTVEVLELLTHAVHRMDRIVDQLSKRA
jgi:hypothetical protein